MVPPPPAVEVAEPEPAAAPSEPTYYVVEPGDTLGDIARQFDTSIDALLQANGLDNADMLTVGQRLLVRP